MLNVRCSMFDVRFLSSPQPVARSLKPDFTTKHTEDTKKKNGSGLSALAEERAASRAGYAAMPIDMALIPIGSVMIPT
jgi:hypothetical protein